MQLSKSKLTFAQRFAQALLLRNQNQCTTTNHKFPHMDFDVWLVTSLCVHVLSLSTHTNRDLKVAIPSTCHSFRSFRVLPSNWCCSQCFTETKDRWVCLIVWIQSVDHNCPCSCFRLHCPCLDKMCFVVHVTR